MRKSRFTEEQIIKVLKEHAAGLSSGEVCRKPGIIAIITPFIGAFAFYWIICTTSTDRYCLGVGMHAGDSVRTGSSIINAALRLDRGAG